MRGGWDGWYWTPDRLALTYSLPTWRLSFKTKKHGELTLMLDAGVAFYLATGGDQGRFGLGLQTAMELSYRFHFLEVGLRPEWVVMSGRGMPPSAAYFAGLNFDGLEARLTYRDDFQVLEDEDEVSGRSLQFTLGGRF
jgi:hypothetical protein